MRMVGTSRTHTVAAAPKVNVSGRVVVDEVLEVDVVVLSGTVDEVVGPGTEDVVVEAGEVVEVVVVAGSQASGKVVVRVTDSAPRVYVIVTGPVPADAGYGMSVVPPELNTSGTDPPVEKLSVPV